MSDSDKPPLLDAHYIESLLLLAKGDPSILESVYAPLLDEALRVAKVLESGAPAELEALLEEAEVLKAPGLVAIAAGFSEERRIDTATAIRAEVKAIGQAILGIRSRFFGPSPEPRPD